MYKPNDTDWVVNGQLRIPGLVVIKNMNFIGKLYVQVGFQIHLFGALSNIQDKIPNVQVRGCLCFRVPFIIYKCFPGHYCVSFKWQYLGVVEQ